MVHKDGPLPSGRHVSSGAGHSGSPQGGWVNETIKRDSSHAHSYAFVPAGPVAEQRSHTGDESFVIKIQPTGATP